MPNTPHTLRVMDDDLDQLRALVSEMGGRAEAAIANAVGALLTGDEDRAATVIAADARIDALALQAERQAVTMIALRHPMADDLRDVLAALKISSSIARIGDCAKNIAYRVANLRDGRRIDELKIVPAMLDAVSDMVKGALDAFVKKSAGAAHRVAENDQAVDDYYACLFRALVAHMTKHPDDITPATHLLFVAQKLERIGDHATTIAEIVHHAATGDQLVTSNSPAMHEAGALEGVAV